MEFARSGLWAPDVTRCINHVLTNTLAVYLGCLWPNQLVCMHPLSDPSPLYNIHLPLLPHSLNQTGCFKVCFFLLKI